MLGSSTKERPSYSVCLSGGQGSGNPEDFASRLASQLATNPRAPNVEPFKSLPEWARKLDADREDRLNRMKHAAGEMERLATDMESFGRIAPGACLPDVAPAAR